jgi:uncharacterized protein YggU (UPF0235/DUF167 family)
VTNVPDEPVGEIRVRVQPRARRSEIVGERDGALVVRVNEPPADGRANAAVCRLIADTLDLARGRVSVKHGAGARDKLVRVEGISGDLLMQVLRRVRVPLARAADRGKGGTRE